jgi:translation initiation factor IF-2
LRPYSTGSSSWGQSPFLSARQADNGSKSESLLLPHEIAARKSIAANQPTKNASNSNRDDSESMRKLGFATPNAPNLSEQLGWRDRTQSSNGKPVPKHQGPNIRRFDASPSTRKTVGGSGLRTGLRDDEWNNLIKQDGNTQNGPPQHGTRTRKHHSAHAYANAHAPGIPKERRPVPHTRSTEKSSPTASEDQFLAQFESKVHRSSVGNGRPAGAQNSSSNWGQLRKRAPAGQNPRTAAANSNGESKFWAEARDRLNAPNQTWTDTTSAQTSSISDESARTKSKAARDLESFEIQRGGRRVDDRRHRDDVDYPSKKGKKNTSRRRRNDENEDELDDELVDVIEEKRRRKAERKARKAENEVEESGPPQIFLPEFINVNDLGQALKIKPKDFLVALEELGFEDISTSTIMTGETAGLIAMEFGFEPVIASGELEDLKPRPVPEDPSVLPPRPPVVTIMGHVDHGKTTLLDWLRKSSVAAQEHGGITQHIGAFIVKMSSGKQITFLDTPGHAAFLTMRQRGANVTDIVILVVAADDSVMPQTIEAIKHARAAKVPIIVAINKIDKDDARPDQVKADLARNGVEIEDFGGDVQVVCVSGKTGKGMDQLEENILTLSEILDMRAETDGMAEGWVLEASVKSVGKVATVLVKRGTVKKGDCIVAGNTWARIRVLRNEAGMEIDEAPPGTPVEILGWRDLPAAGDRVLQATCEDQARTAVDYRIDMQEREKSSNELAAQERRQREAAAAEESASVEGAESNESGLKTVNFIVKADVVGSVEAVCATMLEIGNNEVTARILRSSAGQVTESDVDQAAISKCIIINFNNPIGGHIKRMAEDLNVKIIDHSVIYHLADDVKAALADQLDDTISTRVLGEAEIITIFPINVKGRVYKNIAGCRIRNGMIGRTSRVRIVRQGETIFDGKLSPPLSPARIPTITNFPYLDRQDGIPEARQEGCYGDEERHRVRYFLGGLPRL